MRTRLPDERATMLALRILSVSAEQMLKTEDCEAWDETLIEAIAIMLEKGAEEMGRPLPQMMLTRLVEHAH